MDSLLRHATALAILVIVSPSALAQETVARPSQPEPGKERVLVPLELQVVVSRYQGEKKMSSLPFLVAVNANDADGSGLRMGTQVPVPTTTFTPLKGDGPQAPVVSFSYRDLGTNIDCNAQSLEDGRFRVGIVVEDSSVYTNPETPAHGPGERPVFRSFKSTNTLVLRDGQTRQFTAATDRVNGEVVKVDVTLKVVK